jgi:hypothetical protein
VTTPFFLLFSFAEAFSISSSTVFSNPLMSAFHIWVDTFFTRPCPSELYHDPYVSMHYGCISQVSMTYFWIASLAFSAATWISASYRATAAAANPVPEDEAR